MTTCYILMLVRFFFSFITRRSQIHAYTHTTWNFFEGCPPFLSHCTIFIILLENIIKWNTINLCLSFKISAQFPWQMQFYLIRKFYTFKTDRSQTKLFLRSWKLRWNKNKQKWNWKQKSLGKSASDKKIIRNGKIQLFYLWEFIRRSHNLADKRGTRLKSWLLNLQTNLNEKYIYILF